MPPCSHAKCVALAGPTGECVAHAAGYRLADGAELRCGNCRRLVMKAAWYRLVDGDVRHVPPCTAHPDVIAEREKAAAGS